MNTLRWTVLVLAGGLALGCGDDDDRGGADASVDRSVQDSTVGDTSTGDTGTDTSVPDAQVDGGTPGMCGGGACDLITGGGCGMAMGCYFSGPMGMAPAATCLPAGIVGEGQACTNSNDCAPGHDCPMGIGVCTKVCCVGSDMGCPTGQTCSVQLVDGMGNQTGVGLCRFSSDCDLVAQTGCEMGQGCYLNGPDGSRTCIESTENLTEGTACMAANACAPGLGCIGAAGGPTTCQKHCTIGDDATCGATQTCSGRLQGQTMVGFCQPMSM
ncbi:MAG: hypothetical protein AAGF12_24040 [Myxococcota bacterium]